MSGILLIIFTFFTIKDLQNKKNGFSCGYIDCDIAFEYRIFQVWLGYKSNRFKISCVVIYALLKRNWVLLVLSTLAAVMIHPTNIGLFIFSLLFIFIGKLSEAKYSKEKKNIIYFIQQCCSADIHFINLHFTPLSNWLPGMTAVHV